MRHAQMPLTLASASACVSARAALLLASFSLGTTAFAQTLAPISRSTDEPDLYIDISGGLAISGNGAKIGTAVDLDNPVSAPAAKEIDAAFGTALNLGFGVELDSGLTLGVEAALISHNIKQDDFTPTGGAPVLEIDASATALGGLMTLGYDFDLGNDMALNAQGGFGYFANSADGKVSDGVTQVELKENTRYSLGYTVGSGISWSPSSASSFSLDYKFVSAGPASTGHAIGTTSTQVLDFGNLTSHQVLLGAYFKF